jgi:uncharacterized protein YecT (DUF1311 family)
MLENIIYGIGGWLGGLLTTFILRWARKDHITEGLAQMDAAVSVKKRMRDEGFTEDEIASVMRMATRRPRALEKTVEEAEEEDFSDLNEARSQAEMNMAAYRRYEKLDLEMRHAYEQAEAALEGEQLERLQKSQEAWLKYRELNGKIYSMMQGTMWRMVGAMVMSKITKRRTEDLKGDRSVFKGEPG